MKETQNIEFKRQWRDDFLAELCGFANAQGGTLYIGVDDKGNVVGIENAKQLLEKLPNLINQTMGLLATINLLTEDGKEYLSVSVSAAEQPVSYRGKYYYRSGTTLQEMNGSALQSFLLRKMNLSWDAVVQPNATIEDIDREAVDYFMRHAIEAQRIDPETRNDSTEKILRNLKLIDDQGHLTMAALLLFGKDIERWNMSAVFRIGRFQVSRDNLIIHDNIVCPLIMMPDRVISTLRSKYLVSPIHYEGLFRKEPLEIPEDGLREIICNAIVHKDYTGTFIQMRVWDDRVELWNIGTLPEGFTVETLMAEHDSRPRNMLIAKVFYLAGFIEAWGRGYEKIRKAFENEQLQFPTFEQVRGGMLATIQRERFVAINNGALQKSGQETESGTETTQKTTEKTTKKTTEKTEGVAEKWPESGQKNIVENTENIVENAENIVENIVEKLSAKQAQIIRLMAAKPTISAKEISKEMSIALRNVQVHIKKLQEKGIIRRVGPDKGGHWEVIEKP